MHLNLLEGGPEEVLKQAAMADVDRLITIGTGPGDMPLVLQLAQRLFPQVACSLGVHPHEASLYNPDVEKFIRDNAVRPEVVAIGETGLDYYYNNSPREVQIEAFRAQMRVARDLNLPVEIHTRDAEPDTMQILREFKGQVRGLLHCFTGTQALADVGLECGFHLSISGVVTFKNAQALRDVVKSIPLDHLHVETDAPFLAPIPERGKKNHPAFIVHTARVVAELKGITPEQLQAATRQNAKVLFPKLQLN